MRHTISLRPFSEWSSRSGFVECELIHPSLDEATEFNALSYAWGDPTVTESILLDGNVFTVTANLDAALDALSEHLNWPEMYLWVGAICINQADIEERNCQVLKMKEIYQCAKQVLVWLGTCTPGVEVAVAKLSGLKEIVQPSVTELMETTGSALWRDVVMKCKEETSANIKPHGPHFLEGRQFWSGLNEFYEYPWWNGSWILQEVVPAKDATFLCGEWVFDVLFLRQGDTCLRAVRPDFHARYVSKVSEFKEPYELDSSLLKLISLGRGSEASDPRDKVFAFLALATDVGSEDITPNYHLSKWEIYTKVASWFITK